MLWRRRKPKRGKLLEKQKERARKPHELRVGNVDIPQEAFMAWILEADD